MQIGLLTSDLSYKHGWGTYSLSLIKALQDQDHNLTILTARNSTSADNLSYHPILPSVVPQESHTLIKLCLWQKKVADLLKHCDVIHTTVEIYAPLVALIAKSRPTFMTAHGSYINLPKIRRFPINRIYQYAYEQTNIICVSKYTQKIARQIVPKADTTVVLNAVTAEHFAEVTHQNTDYPIIVTTGGVKGRKGTLELVRAVAIVRKTLPDVRLYVLGSLQSEPGYVEKIRAVINTLELQNAVHLLGFVSDAEMLEWYSKADVFALPSINAGWKFEGFGLATMEASASGVPVIGTRDCGAEDAIEHGKTGLLISQENIAEELPEALLKLLTQKELARKMGEAGRRKAQSYTWDDVGKQVTKLYKSQVT